MIFIPLNLTHFGFSLLKFLFDFSPNKIEKSIIINFTGTKNVLNTKLNLLYMYTSSDWIVLVFKIKSEIQSNPLKNSSYFFFWVFVQFWFFSFCCIRSVLEQLDLKPSTKSATFREHKFSWSDQIT